MRPLVDTGAMVFVVFGIQGVNRTRRPDNHVIGDMVHALSRESQAQSPASSPHCCPERIVEAGTLG